MASAICSRFVFVGLGFLVGFRVQTHEFKMFWGRKLWVQTSFP